MNEICSINLDDDVSFRINSVAPIRNDDAYGGYRVKMDAIFEQIITPLSIDISTGDVITPEAVEYEISGIMDDKIRIKLWGYSIETVLAEKVETILNRDVTNTRPRDFYDIYILEKGQIFDAKVFKEALRATSEHRGSWEKIKDYKPIIEQIESSDVLKGLWKKYRDTFFYAREISFEDTITAIRKVLA